MGQLELSLSSSDAGGGVVFNPKELRFDNTISSIQATRCAAADAPKQAFRRLRHTWFREVHTMSYFVRIGLIKDPRTRKVRPTSRGYAVTIRGKAVVGQWGKIEALGPQHTRFYWAGANVPQEKLHRFKTAAAARRFRNELVRRLLSDDALHGRYRRISPAGRIRSYVRKPKLA